MLTHRIYTSNLSTLLQFVCTCIHIYFVVLLGKGQLSLLETPDILLIFKIIFQLKETKLVLFAYVV